MKNTFYPTAVAKVAQKRVTSLEKKNSLCSYKTISAITGHYTNLISKLLRLINDVAGLLGAHKVHIEIV